MQCPVPNPSKLKKLAPLAKGPMPPAKIVSGIMKMKDLTGKKRGKGYNPFDDDDHKKGKKKKKGSGGSSSSTSSGGSSGSRGFGGAIMKFFRRFCGCLCPKPKPPSLSNAIVNHRKISRVASTESLAKETSGVLEKTSHPHHRHRQQSKDRPVSLGGGVNPFNSFSIEDKNPFDTFDEDTSSDVCFSASSSPAKPTWPVLPPVVPNPRSMQVPPENKPNGGYRSVTTTPVVNQKFSHVNPIESPDLNRIAKRPRPTHLALAVHPAQRRRSSTPTPSGDSPVSTPGTPKMKPGSLAHMRASLSNLVGKATHSPKIERVQPFCNPDESEAKFKSRERGGGGGRGDDEEEEVPEAACLRPASGGVNNPARECFGSLMLRVLSKQGRWVKVVILGLSGLPWVGGSGGLMLEVAIEPHGRSQWLVLPHAHGPNVGVKLEATVKIPRDMKGKKRGLVKVGVWICGRVWRHASLGYALLPPVETPTPHILPLLHHSEMSGGQDQVEVTLRYDHPDGEFVSASQGEVTLTLEVLKAKNLRPFHPGVLSKARHSRKKEQVEVVCRVGLWVKGDRVTRESSTPVKLPVTQDPVIRTRCVFTIPKENLQHAAIIIKVLYTSKWTNEDTIGRVQLGPLLYLGTSPEQQASQCPPSDYNTSITLSHWGLALKTKGPVTMWHYLQL